MMGIKKYIIQLVDPILNSLIRIQLVDPKISISWLIQYQILTTKIIRIVRQTVRRISNEILGVKGLRRTIVSVVKMILRDSC